MLEFVGVAVVLMVPLVYLALAVLDVQRNVFAVTQAAREAGRVVATADTLGSGEQRAQVAVAYALADQGVPADAQLSYVPVGSGCGPGDAASLDPGAGFAVCVTRSVPVPGVPAVLQGQGITVVGRFVVEVDSFREGGG